MRSHTVLALALVACAAVSSVSGHASYARSGGPQQDVAIKFASCPFIGSAVNEGSLPIVNPTDPSPMARIADVVALGNTGSGSNFGQLLNLNALLHHNKKASSATAASLDTNVPVGMMSLELPGSTQAHPGHSGILMGNPLKRATGQAADQAKFAKLVALATGKNSKGEACITPKQIGRFVGDNLAADKAAVMSPGPMSELVQRTAAHIKLHTPPLIAQARSPAVGAALTAPMTSFAFLGSHLVVAASAEWSELMVLMKNSPFTEGVAGEQCVRIQDIQRMFVDKQFPSGWTLWTKTVEDWAVVLDIIAGAAAARYYELNPSVVVPPPATDAPVAVGWSANGTPLIPTPWVAITARPTAPVKKTASATLASSITSCPAGEGLVGTKPPFSCAKCAVNTFKADTNMVACTPCPANEWSLAGSTFCSCNAGFARTTAGAACTICAAGTWSAPGSSACSACPAGTVPNVASGATNCISCPIGQGLIKPKNPTDLPVCAPCPAGFAKNDATLSACSPCQTNAWSPEGAATCFWCDEGTVSEIPAASTGCVTCPFGNFLPPNSYTQDPDSTTVIATAVNAWKAADQQRANCVAASSCTGAQLADFVKVVAVRASELTVARMFKQTSAKCQACPVNTWQDDSGQSVCDKCPAGLSTGGATGQFECTVVGEAPAPAPQAPPTPSPTAPKKPSTGSWGGFVEAASQLRSRLMNRIFQKPSDKKDDKKPKGGPTKPKVAVVRSPKEAKVKVPVRKTPRGSQVHKSKKPTKAAAEKAEKKPKAEKAEKKPKGDKAEKKPKGDKAEKKPKADKAEKKEKAPKAEKPVKEKKEKKIRFAQVLQPEITME